MRLCKCGHPSNHHNSPMLSTAIGSRCFHSDWCVDFVPEDTYVVMPVSLPKAVLRDMVRGMDPETFTSLLEAIAEVFREDFSTAGLVQKLPQPEPTGFLPGTLLCEHNGVKVVAIRTTLGLMPYPTSSMITSCRTGNPIQAIKEYRAHFNTGLKDAKDAIDAVRKELNL